MKLPKPPPDAEGNVQVRETIRWSWHRLKFGMVSAVRPYPSLMLPYASLVGRGAQRVRSTSEIVIEGFERSGNTFAVTAFSYAQQRPVSIAHHLHASSQVIYASRRGIPALVLLRDARESLLSFLVFHPAVSTTQAMRTWLRFHRPLLPISDAFVLARFPTVTSDLGRVIACVNDRFGTAFNEFVHTEDNVRACFRLMDEGERARTESAWIEETVARPSAWRDERKVAIGAQLDDAPVRLREEVRETYAALHARADV